jgi:hypothetical protein
LKLELLTNSLIHSFFPHPLIFVLINAPANSWLGKIIVLCE